MKCDRDISISLLIILYNEFIFSDIGRRFIDLPEIVEVGPEFRDGICAAFQGHEGVTDTDAGNIVRVSSFLPVHELMGYLNVRDFGYFTGVLVLDREVHRLDAVERMLVRTVLAGLRADNFGQVLDQTEFRPAAVHYIQRNVFRDNAVRFHIQDDRF